MSFQPVFKRVIHEERLGVVLIAKIICQHVFYRIHNDLVKRYPVLDAILLLFSENVYRGLSFLDSGSDLTDGQSLDRGRAKPSIYR